MNASCLLGRHSAVPSEVRNQGFHFSQCGCCGRDMIRMRGAWRTVPKDFRVVWKRVGAPAAEAVPQRIVRNLPVLSRSPFQQRVEGIVRRISETLDLARCAAREVGWSFAARCRALRDSLAEPFLPRQLALPLAWSGN